MYKSLNEIAQITMGQSPKSSAYNQDGNGLPFLQGRTTFGRIYPSFDTWTTEWNKECDADDILFTVRAPVGDVNIAQTQIALGRGVAGIRAKNVLSKYLYYLLYANKSTFIASSSGTIYDSINKDQLDNVKLKVHNDEEQRHIVDTIGSVDNLIEKYEEIIHKNNKIFNYLYDKNTQTKEVILQDIAEIKYGKGLTASDLSFNYKYKVYGGNGIIGTLPTYEHENNKIAISCRGAASGNILLTEECSTISSNSLYLNLYDETHFADIYYYLLKANLTSLTTGSAQPQITIENIKDLKMKISTNELLNKNAIQILKNIFKYNSKIDKLKETKELLLKKYFG